MKKTTFRLAVVALVLLQAFVYAQGTLETWDNNIGHRVWEVALETEDRAKMISLWEGIAEDLKSEQNPLAGTYVKGGHGSGFFLRWSSKEFVVVPYFDQNLITDYGYGSVTFVDSSKVLFTSAKQLKGGRGLGTMPTEWTAVSDYFMPVESLKDFGEYRAGLGVYNEFIGPCCDFVPDFLVKRIEDQDRPLSYPVPSRYQDFFISPITGLITLVGRHRQVKDWGYEGELASQWMERAVLIPVKISVGSRHGVKKKMLFRIIGEPHHERYLQVTRVSSNESQGYVVQDLSGKGVPGFFIDNETNQQKPLQKIRVGVKITTSLPVD